MQIQGLTPPQLQLIRRISAALLGPQPTPGRGIEYDRVLATNGDIWELQGLADRVTLEQLFAIHDNGTVWVTDPDRGNFHAIIEVEAAWTADDCVQLEV